MQHPLTDSISTNEEAFILRALESGLRVDGRRLLEARPLRVDFGVGSGACEVRLGQTSVLATATAELVEPYPDRAAEGLLQFFVEFSPMASSVFEPGRPSEPAVELMRLLERTIRKSQAVDLEALCVVASKRVWSVRCDITVTDHRGNLTDAAVLAALAALRHLRLPSVAVTGNGDDAEVEVLPAERAEPQPLVFHHTPVAASLAFFRGAEGGAPLVLLDPTDREELVMLGSLVVVLNQHDELCALHKPGGLPVAPAQLLECVREAAAAVQPMREALETALALHHQQLQARAAALAKTGRVPTQREPPGDAAVSVSVPAALEDAPPPAAAAAAVVQPLTSAAPLPKQRLDGAKLGLDGKALLGTATVPTAAAATAAAAEVVPSDAAFLGGESAWDEAAPTAAVTPSAPASAAPAAAAAAAGAVDSDDEEETVTLDSTLEAPRVGTTRAAAPAANGGAGGAPKSGGKNKKKRRVG